MSVAIGSTATVDKARFDAEFDAARTTPDEVGEVEATICFVTTIICPASCDITETPIA